MQRFASGLVLALFLLLPAAGPSASTPAGRIAFTRFTEGTTRIAVVASTGRAAVDLVKRGPHGQGEPAWSPDGRWIAFNGRDRDGTQGLYVARVSGRFLLRRLTRNEPTTEAGSTASSDVHPVWSPDGKWIMFQRFRPPESDLYLVRPSGGAPRLFLRDGLTPAWSPDGRRIAFVRSAGNANTDLWIVGANRRGLRPLTTHPSRESEPDWSPDGKRIVFVRYNDGNFELWTIGSEGKSPSRLTRVASNEVNATWSPDGTSIAFASDRSGGQFDIYVMRTNGTRPRRLTTSGEHDIAPVWQPLVLSGG